jgi:hypothetical protein
MGDACSTCGRDEKCIESFIGEREGKRLLGRRSRRWEYNIRMNLREIK